MIIPSECELKALLCVYNHHAEFGEAPDLKSTIVELNGKYKKDWKPQTVSTFLSRLVKKGLLITARKGRYSYYTPVHELDDF